MRKRAVECVSQQLRLEMQPCVLHRLFDIETLKRQGHFFNNGLEAPRLDVSGFARAASDIDGNEAVDRGFGSYRPEQPNTLCRLVNDSAGGNADGGDHRGDAFLHRLWHRAGFGRFKATIGRDREESGLLPERIGKVILNRRDQVRYTETGGQTPREFVQLLNFLLALTQRFGLAPQA
jgi:hypothetical protein